MADHAVRLLQRNDDRSQIYGLVTAGAALGVGPLALADINLDDLDLALEVGEIADAELGRRLVSDAGAFHPLDAFFHFYGYPPDVIEWIESTPLSDANLPPTAYTLYGGGGREVADVAARLQLDPARLQAAASAEGSAGGVDSAGDPLFYTQFDENWAVADASGYVTINPNAYRFKAWLSLEQR